MQNNNYWTDELTTLRKIILTSQLEKSIKWGAEVFTLNGRNVISYGGFKNYFAIWFYNGVFLKDPYKVLINAQEGKTKSLRQWRFTTKREIDKKKILEYIQEAIEIENKGLKLQPEKFKPLAMSDLLMNELKTNKTLKLCFEKLSPGKQKEYNVYINAAKQDETKLNRLHKIKPMIIQGIGLNDKYKK